MASFPEPAGESTPPTPRLDTGLDILDAWADAADDKEKETVYPALFATIDCSLFRTYTVIDDQHEKSEFYVLLSRGLVIKMRMNAIDSFGLVYIGTRTGTPGLANDQGTDRAA